MKSALLLLIAFAVVGCTTSQDPEDRHFFNRGWLNPKRDIDEDPSFDAPQKEHDKLAPKKEKYLKDPLIDP